MGKLFLVILALLAGCATQPAVAPNDYGPVPVLYEETAKAYFDRSLKDPESARYRFSKPVKAYGKNGLLRGGDVVFSGYLVDVEVNAKNSFGGYTGFKPYMMFFRGENLVRVMEGREHVLVTRVP